MSEAIELLWTQVEPELRERGIATWKITPAAQTMLLARLAAHKATEHSTWQEIADEIAEEHPAWETEAHRRYRHAEELVAEYGNDDFGLCDADEVAKHRYAAIVCWDGRSAVRAAGDDDASICSLVIDLRESEDPEEVESIVSLDTGEVYAQHGNFEISLTVRLNRDSVTRRISR
jgi:hypothetical protein